MRIFTAACILSALTVGSTVIVGLDLGDDYFKAASLRIIQGSAVIDAILNVQSKRKTHTMVGFRDQDRYFGADAFQLLPRFPMQMVTGSALLAGRAYNDSAFQNRLREWMYPYNLTENARGGIDITVDGNITLSGEELLAQIFSLVSTMTAAHINQSATGLVIAVPDNLPLPRRHAIIDAANIAGLRVAALVPTATAAAVQWGVQRREEISARGVGVPTFMAIVDVGAYHAEASVVAFVPAAVKRGAAALGSVRTLASVSTEEVGGRALDVALARRLIGMYKERTKSCPPSPVLKSICDGTGDGSEALFGVPPEERLAAAKVWARLINAAEAVRIGLSALGHTRVTLPADAIGTADDYVFQIQRADAEAVWRPYLERAAKLVEEAFVAAAPEAAILLDAGDRALAAIAARAKKAGTSAPAAANATDANATESNSTDVLLDNETLVNETEDAAAQAAGEDETKDDAIVADAAAADAADAEAVAADARPPIERLLDAVRSVEIFGGTSRIPLMQQLLSDRYGASLKRQLNTDEAAVMGCAYIAAQMSSGFRVRAFTANITLPQRVSFALTDDDGSTTPKTLFRAGAKFARKAVVSNRTKDFNVSVYITPTDHTGTDIGTPSLVAQYELRGITSAYSLWREATEERGGDPDATTTNRTVRLQFDLNATGLVSLAGVEARIAEMVEHSENKTERVLINETEEEAAADPAAAAADEADAAKPAEEGAPAEDPEAPAGDEKKDADAAEGADAAAKEAGGEEEAAGAEKDGKADEKKKATKPRPKRRFRTTWRIVNTTRSVPRTKKVDHYKEPAWHPLPFTKRDVLTARRKAQRHADREALKAATGTARNALEALLYESRGERGLENEALKPFFEEGDVERIEALLNDVSEWLDYGEGSEHTVPEPYREMSTKIYDAFKGPLDRFEADAAEKRRIADEEARVKAEADAAAAAAAQEAAAAAAAAAGDVPPADGAASPADGAAAGATPEMDESYYANLEKIYKEYGLDPDLVKDLRKPKSGNIDDLIKKATKGAGAGTKKGSKPKPKAKAKSKEERRRDPPKEEPAAEKPQQPAADEL